MPEVSWALRGCVWELTLRCNAACVHCGSDAGAARPDELSAREALSVCDELAGLGAKEVTLSGGEPLLRDDWSAIASRLTGRGVRVDLITNGLLLDRDAARRIRDAGAVSASISVDGPPPIHDRLRGTPGGFEKAMAAAGHVRAAGLPVGAVTQVSRANLSALGELEARLVEAGFQGWQIQLTAPQGRAEETGLALGPEEVPSVAAFILDPARSLRPYAADDIGWMNRREPELRSSHRPTDQVFVGCQAGLSILGLTADGTVRGCLSLPAHFDEANVREVPLARIWEDPERFSYNRRFDERGLTGACASCAFRRVCRGGCKSLAWAHQRALTENRWCLRVTEPG
jgi:radical SAM protein with 4Fe4S-binding SPASM domain